jgi:phosphoenolpyruvate carboxykinase (ATP)
MNNIYFNPSTPFLYKHAISLFKDIQLSSTGALVAYSGKYTGRKPDWKKIVNDQNTEDIWWGKINNPISTEDFNDSKKKAIQHIYNNSITYQVDLFINWNPNYQIKVRLLTNNPYHALFLKNMCIQSDNVHDTVDFTIYDSSDITYRNNEGLIGLNLTTNEFIIMGTQYAGEIKKGLLTYMMYKMPRIDCLPLHSSANIGKNNDVTLFFGLSGTGKTTLSTESNRTLIGDDEHVWCPEGVFNVEGGCYAKCKDLSKEDEPEIYNAIRFGSVVENMVLDKDHNLDFNDVSITENTRCAYPLSHLTNVMIPAFTNHHPKNIVMLCCDAFGLLPPIVKLNKEQAVYFFISGYTSKVAGTEQGVTEPQVTFSSCFGEPFLVHHPKRYGELLEQYISKYNCNVWLLNTGWVEGDYKSGRRISIKYSREIINSIHNDSILNEEYYEYPVFKFKVPKKCGNIPEQILNPSSYRKDNYLDKLENLYKQFEENMITL